MFEFSIMSRTHALAPDHVNSGRLSGVNSKRPVGRAERTGPIGPASVDWKIAINRVDAFSTSSSYTTSAWLMPDCGCASGTLSIFTTSAGLVTVLGSPSTPVNGATGGGAGAVVLVVVDDGALLEGVALFAAAFPPHAASNDTSTSARRFVRTHAL